MVPLYSLNTWKKLVSRPSAVRTMASLGVVDPLGYGTGISTNNKIYVDRVMPLGGRSGPPKTRKYVDYRVTCP